MKFMKLSQLKFSSPISNQIRGVFQRIVRGKLRFGCQRARGGRLGVKAGVV